MTTFWCQNFCLYRGLALSNWQVKRQSSSEVKPDARFQIVKTRVCSTSTTRSTSPTSPTFPTSRPYRSWVVEPTTQEGNVIPAVKVVNGPAVVLNIFPFNSVYFIFDKKFLVRFPYMLVFLPPLYMNLYIFLRKYSSCNLGPNIECFNSLFLCSFVLSM